MPSALSAAKSPIILVARVPLAAFVLAGEPALAWAHRAAFAPLFARG
jgi:hypothetical protein